MSEATTAAIRGSCLCGGVRFEVAQVLGPFELCHCNRCRKVSGSAFVAGLRVAGEGFRILAGRELIRHYEAPLLEVPPPYTTSFCSCCGSPVPDPPPDAESFELPAGLLDSDPGARPDRHIFIEHEAPWHSGLEELPRLTGTQLRKLRHPWP